ncbi:hypothetical protein [Endozoicomonas arenosclerae]|uniref:hypothetical protein n=1 Tax=Endozoicomonas arenosclerae TaxID=1633495 RepID=UPI0007853F85|nr:hypothetical protein [Endozoicomonas arenosclerae]
MDRFDAGAKGKPPFPPEKTEPHKALKKDEGASQACKPKIPKLPESVEKSVPGDKSVDDRSVNELPEVLTNIEWFEFSAELDPRELNLRRTKYYCDIKNLEATAAVYDAMEQQEKRKGKKKKGKPKDVLQRIDLPDSMRANRCSLLYEFGRDLTHLGQLEEAQTVLYQALKDVDVSPELASDIAYALFMNYSLAGDCSNALTQLQLSIRHGNRHALWEVALIRLGLVEEYRVFADPEKALLALDDLVKHISKLKERKHPEGYLYSDTADTAYMVESIWDAFRLVLACARSREEMEKRLHKVLRVAKSDQTESDLQELLELFRGLATSIGSQQMAPLVNFYFQFGEATVEKLWKFWTEKDEVVELVDSDTRGSKLARLKSLLSSEFSPEELRILMPEGSSESLVEALDNFINRNVYDFWDLLQIAVLAEDSLSQPASRLELSLEKLVFQAHNSPECDHRLSAMSVSASPVLWARDCLRSLKGMDLALDLKAAVVRAECLRRQNPGMGLFLKGLCYVHPASNSYAKALPLIDEAALDHSNPVAMIWMGDAICLRDSKSDPSKANFQKALKYYLHAGRFGSATGYIRAADLLLRQGRKDFRLYEYCSAYFERALELMKDQGDFEEVRYCQAMAELCHETYLLEKERQTEVNVSSDKGSGSTEEGGSDGQSHEKDESKPSEKQVLDTPGPKAEKDERVGASKAAKPAKKPMAANEFWKQLNEIDTLISDEQYYEGMEALKKLQKKKLSPLHSAYLLQKKAWLCLNQVKNRFPDPQERALLIEKGLSYSTEGINRLTGLNLNKDNLGQLKLSAGDVPVEHTRCLGSLVSTVCKLSNLNADFGTARKLMAPGGGKLFRVADAVNPERLNKRLKGQQYTQSKLQVVDEETFKAMQAAL